ncbi:protein-disulfide reductase DsbD [Methylicorpusculum sp.]|uniref:protein-disulfide reductase DsbD n=1 Tax=Methylicorpusculum sp. TaxID=2713644 RepID=UPI002733B136|nr:protein-disulfide reductase DsbD [Methylicorpusculum sp.]MDP3531490.1 protein-disulfide reductase DsbD [Methylicorpusculum sp.]MDZ4151073.1 protein-disulfide reductase DsbD [Methylicorpusculum sp.]
MFNFRIISFFLLCLIAFKASALAESDLLPVEQAFKLSAKAAERDKLMVSFEIAEGYYLYQNKIRIESLTPAIKLGEPAFPEGHTYNDEFFGEVITHRQALDIAVPISQIDTTTATSLQLLVQHQGCADAGICYPPQKTTLTIAIRGVIQSTAPPPSTNALIDSLGGIKQRFFQDELLPPDEAFPFFATVAAPDRLELTWQIADGYYLYREKFQLEIIDTEGVKLGVFELPHGKPKFDEAFGEVETLYGELKLSIPLIRSSAAAQVIKLKAKFQGCADRGVCYPPMEKIAELNLPALTVTSVPAEAAKPGNTPLSEQDSIVSAMQQDSFWLTLASFLGFGLLLAFTPCIFPMIPILSGIIVGQGHAISTKRAFLLSLSYVVASAATYTLFGVLAALFGSNLQATFQQPWIVGTFSAVFILLALSMFGFYQLELPKSLQAKIHDSSNQHRDGSLWGAAIMGSLSSLIVGPCVAAPLAGALIYIGQTGDAVLGGSALFAMGFGMGIPLLLVGASAGKLLPKAGRWLNSTKAVFGVIMLAMALWMLERIIAPSVAMFFWAILMIIPAIYLNAIDPLPENAGGWQKLWKGTGVVMLIYGVLLLIGLSAGNHNPLKPLENLNIAQANAATPAAQKNMFQRIGSLQELEHQIDQANANNQVVMLDFYADWCISCKEMENYTFTDTAVRAQLSRFVLLQADVTQNSGADQALLKKFNLIGPPAILFFGPGQQEKTNHRIIGYQDAETFLKSLRQVN